MAVGLRLLLVCFLFSTGRLFAADPEPVHYLGIEQGLSNNAVTTICQDHNGFLWFGTYDGLNRYDGYSFQVFRNVIGDPTSLIDNHVSDLEEDGLHQLWIGCESGLSIYHPATSKFSTPQYRPWNDKTMRPVQLGVHALCRISDGRWMLVSVKNKGLLVFERGAETGLQVPLAEARGAEGNYNATALAFDPLKKLAWVFIRDRGLYRFDLSSRTLRLVNPSLRKADCLRVDSRGTLWLGNENGLFMYEEVANQFTANVLPSSMKVINLVEDRQHRLWVASDGGGVWTISKKGPAIPYLKQDGSPKVNSNAVYAIYEDRDGGKWIGTLRGGINVVQPKQAAFQHVVYTSPDKNDNLVNNFILSFCEDDQIGVWIGTDGAGLRYWNRQANAFTNYLHQSDDPRSISSNFVTSILKDAAGDTWITTWFGGVNRLRKGSRLFEHFTCTNTATGSAENNAWLAYEDRQKQLWVSTTNEGTLYRFNRNTNRFDLFDASISDIQCLSEDRSGVLWGGNYTSLVQIDPVHYKHRVFTVGNTVRSVHEDRQGQFWVGTDGGGLLLFDRKTGRFQRFTTSEGLPSNSVLRLMEDGSGKLWLSTYNGLCRFDPVTKTCRNFSQSDGLQSNQFSFNAALSLQSGEFLFGGIRGFNIFHPARVNEQRRPPSIFLTGLRINNKPAADDSTYVTKRTVDRIEAITVPYNDAFLSLDFVALAFSGNDKIRYAYLLEGWDKTWNKAGEVRTASYARLNEGTYAFKAKVANASGEWSNETTLLTIRVLPPWYRTWWAYLFYLGLLGSVVYAYIRYNKRQERLKYEIKLAVLEKEKEKEVTDKKVSFFTHISHEFRTPLTLIINPLKELMQAGATDAEKKSLSTVYRNARRLLSLVDQLLLFRKVDAVEEQLRIEKFDMVETCREVFLSFSQHATTKHFDFSFQHDRPDQTVYGDKEKIEIILFNLLSNAFKYTEAGGKISLELTSTEKELLTRVNDSGSGIPVETGQKLFESFYRVSNASTAKEAGFGVGLYVSYKLAQAHKGQLSYTSQPGVGSVFCLQLLKGKTHFGSAYISEDFKSGPSILKELVEDPLMADAEDETPPVAKNESGVIDKLRSSLPVMVVVDDNAEMRSYIVQVFSGAFTVYEAQDGDEGYDLVVRETPAIVISDVMMKNVGGIELCQKIKGNPAIAHIPVVLLTGSTSDQTKLQGIQGGAEDYILKPFDKDIIVAKVQNILQERNRMKTYFFNAVTLQPASGLTGEHKFFIEKCMAVVEAHLDDPDFTINTFCREIGMSHPSLYKKVKAVSGLTVNVFIRYIRLRKAAEMLITTDKTILEVTYLTGFNDVRYFREQFQKLFQMNPSDYIKRYRRVLGGKPVDK